ncbi:Elongation of very long chain fatty acids protein [Blattella germanica]|uniref:Elongation of very long chain fatty acids protein n=1 Tax=Blattella germanica TaxID=6973 RepID=A0A2P8YDP0_BLAGE|nr:Elongation of very long chain fatty acids protein [Blattella germanica]QXU64623.1 fatty acid elongase 12 [Blattella germanica]
MAALTTSISEFLTFLRDKSDPRTVNWMFVGNPLPLFAILLFYLYYVKIEGPRFMKNRKPYDLNSVIRVYNIGQMFACVYLFYSILTSGWTDGQITLGCSPPVLSYDPQRMRMASLLWWTLLLKMVELLETCFFVWRKKFNQVSFLHVYHHFSTLVLVWMGCAYAPGGMATFPVMINCLVHVIMYAYYLLANMGPKVQKKINKLKPYLTTIQMVQFAILLIHMLPAFKESCAMPKIFPYYYSVTVLMIFYLFYDFYNKSYKGKSHKQ